MKIKHLPLVGGLLLCASCVYASGGASIGKEEPLNRVGTGTTVSVSTSAWTAVPASSSLARRAGIFVSNPKTSSAAMVGVIDTTTPGEATTVRPIEIEAGESVYFPLGGNIRLYLLSLHTSAENVHVQEVGQ